MIKVTPYTNPNFGTRNLDISKKIKSRVKDLLMEQGKGHLPVEVEPTLTGMTVSVGSLGGANPAQLTTKSIVPEFLAEDYFYGKTIQLDEHGDVAANKSDVKEIIDETLIQNIIKSEVK